MKNIEDVNLDSIKWKVGDKKEKFKCAIFSVEESLRSSTDGRCSNFINVKAPDWVIVIPLFKDNQEKHVIMELQYRHGSESITCEFPAGVIEKGESPLDAAKRELLEETGYTASSIKLIGSLSPNSAFMSNRQYVYLAEDLVLSSDQNLDQNEQIEVVSLKLKDAIEKIGNDIFDNAMMSSAAFLLVKELAKENNK